MPQRPGAHIAQEAGRAPRKCLSSPGSRRGRELGRPRNSPPPCFRGPVLGQDVPHRKLSAASRPYTACPRGSGRWGRVVHLLGLGGRLPGCSVGLATSEPMQSSLPWLKDVLLSQAATLPSLPPATHPWRLRPRPPCQQSRRPGSARWGRRLTA